MLKKRGEPGELGNVQLGERLEHLFPTGSQLEAYDAAVLAVLDPPGPAPGLDPVREFHGRVVAEKKVIGDVADGRTVRVVVPADREQQLVLHVGEAHSPGLLLAPVIEATQVGTKGEEISIFSVGQPGHVPL